jgi:hypothetical protein
MPREAKHFPAVRVRRRVYVRIEYSPELREALRQIEQGMGTALLAELLERLPEGIKSALYVVQSSLHLAPPVAFDVDGGVATATGDSATGR